MSGIAGCRNRRFVALALAAFCCAGGGSDAFTCAPDQLQPFMTLRSPRSDAMNHKAMNPDDDDDEVQVRPYRNRSLAWTMRYRQLNPYEQVRKRVIGFGHRSKDDWDEAVQSGQLGGYVPSYPDEMYAPEWVSWEEWLGLMRSYSDAKSLVSMLRIKSLDEYILFVRSDSKRAEGLRIPVRPDIFYKDEWDEVSFFGND